MKVSDFIRILNFHCKGKSIPPWIIVLNFSVLKYGVRESRVAATPNYFLSLTIMNGIEKVLFWGQIFEPEFLMYLDVLRSPESENHIFREWSVCVYVCVYVCTCVRMYMCVYVCEQHNSRTVCSRMFKFGIPNLYHKGM